jgi:hypothetical protein
MFIVSHIIIFLNRKMLTRGVSKKKVVVEDATGKEKKTVRRIDSKVQEAMKVVMKTAVTDKAPNKSAGKKKVGEKIAVPTKAPNKSAGKKKVGEKKAAPTKCASKPSKVLRKPTCVVLYSNGLHEYFKTEAMAREQRSGLPGDMVVEYRCFATKKKADDFLAVSSGDKKLAATVTPSKLDAAISRFGDPNEPFTPLLVDPATLPSKVTARFGNPNANLPIKALNKIVSGKLDRIRCPRDGPMISGDTSGGTAGAYLASLNNVGDSEYLAKMRQETTTGLVEIQVHVFKYKFEPQPKYQVVTFELYDVKQKKTYWTHHAEKWEQTFQSAKSNGYSDLYDDICFQFHSFLMRDVSTSTSGLHNQPWVHEGLPRADGSKYKMDLMGLYALFPFNYTTEEIKDEIRLFGTNALKPIAMQAYDICHFSTSVPLRNSIKAGTGTYWSMLESAFASEIKVIEEDSLDNMFLDGEVFKFMGLLFNEHGHPRDYQNSNLINFSYGRITANDGTH